MKFRAVFVSDVHLGLRFCQIDALLRFLTNNSAETIYLVGDIIDGWELARTNYWIQSYNNLFDLLFAHVRAGGKVFYVIGNHDEFLRKYENLCPGGIVLVNEIIHETADGKKMLVIHGDKFDVAVRYAPWLVAIGDRSYYLALFLNQKLNALTHLFGMRYWSLSAYLKNQVKNVVKFIGAYTELVVQAAQVRGADMVICGHIHNAEIKTVRGVVYMNCGDWVESCSAIVEHFDGRFEIVRSP